AVSVGSVGSTRQVINVAAGTHATDAVNLGQLNAATAAFNARISQLQAAFAAAPGMRAMAFGVPVAPAGGDVRIRADGSTSIGATALVASDAANAVAIGEDAQVTASNAVALGQGSVADEENTVSVGRAGHERRVVNVAAGVHSTDAVNVEQLQASRTSAVQSANAYTDARFRQALLD